MVSGEELMAHQKPLSDLNDYDLVTLNVGGTLHTTTVGTLRFTSPIIGDSHYLRVLFSEPSFGIDVQRDENGHVFIDRNGELFGWVLDFLRNGCSMPLPSDKMQRARLRKEMEFFGLSDALSTYKVVNFDENTPKDELKSVKGTSFSCFIRAPCKMRIKRWIMRVKGACKITVYEQPQNKGIVFWHIFCRHSMQFAKGIAFPGWHGNCDERRAFEHGAYDITLEAHKTYEIKIESINSNNQLEFLTIPTKEVRQEIVPGYNFDVQTKADDGIPLLGVEIKVLQW